MEFVGMGDKAIAQEIGRRIRRKRLSKNLSQQVLGERAGLSRKAISETEGGGSATLPTLIRILRALDSLDELDHFLPEPVISPLERVRMKGKSRVRAYPKRIKVGGGTE
ncbi:MAG: helix-turn-helix transcriptional regulator [bacterium]|nr:helix-turn-helix transcriptional regulator [bacterium]